MGSDNKACIVTVPQVIRFQLSYFLTKKRTIKNILQRRVIIQNDLYPEDVESYTNNLL